MKSLIKIIPALIIFSSANCYAEKTVVDVWHCQFKESKTMADANAFNDKWVAYMNKSVKGGGITSYNLTPIVGDRDGFMFVDVYPNIESWAAGEALSMDSTDEGKALLKEFRSIAKCSNNSLYSSTKH